MINIKKYTLLFTILLFVCQIHADTGNTNRYVDIVYGQDGLNESPAVIQRITRLANLLEGSSDYQLSKALTQVDCELAKQIDKIQKKIKLAHNTKASVNYQEHQHLLLAKTLKSELAKRLYKYKKTWGQFTEKVLKTALDTITPNSDRNKQIKELTSLFLEHLTFEREHIFNDYKRTLQYMAGIENISTLGNVYTPDRLFLYLKLDATAWGKIRHMAKNITESVNPQGLLITWIIETAIDAAPEMIVQGVAQGAGMSATIQFSKEDMAKAKAAQAKLKKASDDSKANIKTQKSMATKLQKAAVKNAKSSVNVSKSDYLAAQQASNQSIAYTARGISGHNDRRAFLVDYPTEQVCKELQWSDKKCAQNQSASAKTVMQADVQFEAAKMLTPGLSDSWYDILGNIGSITGHWIYDQGNKQFIQAAMGRPFYQKPTKKNPKPAPQFASASLNNIFTEYVAPSRSYTISTDVTLVQATYPFFVGVQFNRGRHVSGAKARQYQYRLFGIYGDLKKDGSPELKIVFGSDDTRKSQTTQAVPTLQKAIERTPLATIDTAISKQIGTDPITLSFEIDTTWGQARLTLYQKLGEQKNKIGRWIEPGLDDFMSIFHGIGLMSPGCSSIWSVPNVSIK
ncbi:hypothetical protein HOK96_02390 [bacterium]|nr:hypothetical protein [bacterium]